MMRGLHVFWLNLLSGESHAPIKGQNGAPGQACTSSVRAAANHIRYTLFVLVHAMNQEVVAPLMCTAFKLYTVACIYLIGEHHNHRDMCPNA